MGKFVLITGASRGIGAECAKEFASNGFNVIINYRSNNKQALLLKEELESTYQVEVLLIKADVGNEDEVKNMFLELIEKDVKLDVIVNNAGIAIDQDLSDKTEKEFRQVLNTNLVGPFLVIKYGSSLMNKGAIVNVASTNGIDTEYIESVDYDASKAGVISLTRNFANVLAPNIRVNAVAPGWIDTDMNKELDNDFIKKETDKILLKRFASANEVAKVIYFLASDDASYINKTIVRVDGGVC